MALIYRDGRPYLYRSVRRNGRVTSEYKASGQIAVLLARMEQLDRDQADFRRRSDRRRREEERELRAALDALVADVRALADATLTAAGYHKHKGQWRRRRGNGTGKPTPVGPDPGEHRGADAGPDR